MSAGLPEDDFAPSPNLTIVGDELPPRDPTDADDDDEDDNDDDEETGDEDSDSPVIRETDE
jgi:hypothetical protein